MTNNNEEILEVVDESGVTIGLETRSNVHKKGLLHKEIHVWFFTPEKEIIFQHRAKDKETFPDLLDATAGGHLEAGDSFEQTVLKECLEETGLNLKIEDFVFVRNLRKESFDEVTGLTNNVIRPQYAYLFKGNIADLRIEEGKSEGFVKVPLEKILNLSDEEKKKFIYNYWGGEYLEIFKDAAAKLGLI